MAYSILLRALLLRAMKRNEFQSPFGGNSDIDGSLIVK